MADARSTATAGRGPRGRAARRACGWPGRGRRPRPAGGDGEQLVERPGSKRTSGLATSAQPERRSARPTFAAGAVADVAAGRAAAARAGGRRAARSGAPSVEPLSASTTSSGRVVAPASESGSREGLARRVGDGDDAERRVGRIGAPRPRPYGPGARHRRRLRTRRPPRSSPGAPARRPPSRTAPPGARPASPSARRRSGSASSSPQRRRDRRRVGLGVGDGVPADLGQRQPPGGEHRRAAGHRLEHRQAEALAEARVGDELGAAEVARRAGPAAGSPGAARSGRRAPRPTARVDRRRPSRGRRPAPAPAGRPSPATACTQPRMRPASVLARLERAEEGDVAARPARGAPGRRPARRRDGTWKRPRVDAVVGHVDPGRRRAPATRTSSSRVACDGVTQRARPAQRDARPGPEERALDRQVQLGVGEEGRVVQRRHDGHARRAAASCSAGCAATSAPTCGAPAGRPGLLPRQPGRPVRPIAARAGDDASPPGRAGRSARRRALADRPRGRRRRGRARRAARRRSGRRRRGRRGRRSRRRARGAGQRSAPPVSVGSLVGGRSTPTTTRPARVPAGTARRTAATAGRAAPSQVYAAARSRPARRPAGRAAPRPRRPGAAPSASAPGSSGATGRRPPPTSTSAGASLVTTGVPGGHRLEQRQPEPLGPARHDQRRRAVEQHREVGVGHPAEHPHAPGGSPAARPARAGRRPPQPGWPDARAAAGRARPGRPSAASSTSRPLRGSSVATVSR